MKMSSVKNIKQLIPYYRFTDHEFKKVIIMLSLMKVFCLGWVFRRIVVNVIWLVMSSPPPHAPCSSWVLSDRLLALISS